MKTLAELLAEHRDAEDLPIFLRGFKRDHLAQMFADLGFQSGAEIGVAEGRFSEVLCRANPNLHLRCIDPWAAYSLNGRGRATEEQAAHLMIAREALAPYARVEFLQFMSADAAPLVPEGSLDFVYIDGNHKVNYVREDLALWSERVRSGGIIAGHDYYEFRSAGVIEAVKEFTAMHEIRPWFITDAGRRKSVRTGQYYRESSFFWVNP